METKKRRWPALAAVICLAAAVTALLLVWRGLAPRGQAGWKSITVQVIHGDGSVKEFPLETGAEYLAAALVEGGVVEDNQGPYGLYILTADEGRQEWWQITRAGEQLTTGAEATPIADGEQYELTLTVGYGF